jgi:hypothetical protein
MGALLIRTTLVRTALFADSVNLIEDNDVQLRVLWCVEAVWWYSVCGKFSFLSVVK